MRSLIRWNPRNDVEVNDPFRGFDQMFDDLWRNWPARFVSEGSTGLLRPAMDVIESDKDLTIRVDLPGLKPDDVKVEVEDNILTVSGEVGDTVEKEGDRYHYRERTMARSSAACACRVAWIPTKWTRPSKTAF
jgi:HSP20 family protein